MCNKLYCNGSLEYPFPYKPCLKIGKVVIADNQLNKLIASYKSKNNPATGIITVSEMFLIILKILGEKSFGVVPTSDAIFPTSELIELKIVLILSITAGTIIFFSHSSIC